jgi:uncharacterized membrane protein
MADPGAFSIGAGTAVAIAAMTAATYSCRALGVWLIRHVPLTLRVRRALAALPGSIVVATVLPLTVKAGLPAVLAIAATIGVMLLRRNELMALAAGLAAVSAARAFGL